MRKLAPNKKAIMPKIERLISVFDKHKENLIQEINIDDLAINKLREIFKPGPDDPNMYLVYLISAHEAVQLKKYINIEFDFSSRLYQLGCFMN